MDIIELKEKYEQELKMWEKDYEVYKNSSNHELRRSADGCKHEADKLRIIVEALEKQIPMQAFYEYDNEFICPACGHEEDGYEVTTIKVCPECGQKLKWS